jgi:hypothetical protein
MRPCWSGQLENTFWVHELARSLDAALPPWSQGFTKAASPR